MGVTVGWEGPHVEDNTSAPYANKDANQRGPYSFVEKLFGIYVHSVCSTVLKTLGYTGEQTSPDYLEGIPTWCSERREVGEGRHTPIPPTEAAFRTGPWPGQSWTPRCVRMAFYSHFPNKTYWSANNRAVAESSSSPNIVQVTKTFLLPVQRKHVT